ncbi:hypothetical protein ACIA8I_23580 [Streptomyces rishiriensis]|uniref:hypothetical protein n=1 Tax=Streptomyces rishiriensis TaxID=68264 RepID=UPI003791ED2D
MPSPAAVFAPEPPTPVTHPHAHAGYAGRAETLPAAVPDGDPATGWSHACAARPCGLP